MQTTLDAVLRGGLVLEQPAVRRGYRFNADSILLAEFASRPLERVGHLIDLGAGVGVVALCVARTIAVDRITLIDSDEDSCCLARSNCARAGVGDAARVIQADVGMWDLNADDVADLVVANPPYATPGTGRPSPIQKRDRARRGGIEPFIAACARAMDPDTGRACVCYPAGSLVTLLRAARDVRLHAVRCAWVHATPELPARIALVEFRAHASDFMSEAPIVESSAGTPQS